MSKQGFVGFGGRGLIRVVVVAAAAVVLVGAAQASTAVAATPSCGSTCINLFNRLASPASVLDVLNYNGNLSVGMPVGLAAASNSNPGEDFTIGLQGTVGDFIQVGLAAQGLTPYDSLETAEFEFAPFGVDSGLCVGVVSTPLDGTPVTLQPCGVSAKTVWVFDPSQPSRGSHGALFSAATDSNFSHPEALTDNQGGQPQLTTSALVAGPPGHRLPQSWGASYGTLLEGTG